MIQDLPTDKIHPRDDARTISAANVEALASSIADIGLINPIRVRANSDGWEIIAGNHRLEACKSLGLIEIACDVVQDDEDQASSAMIDENVIRLELSPVERARYMAQRKEIYEARNPPIRANQHTGPRNSQELGTPRRFTAHVAEVTGQSEATIQQVVRQGNNVTSEVLDMIQGTPLDQVTYLNKLSALNPNDQYRAAERDLANARQTERQESAAFKANELAAKARKKAAKAAAKIIAANVPADELAELVSLLAAAGKASDVARELQAL